MAVRWTENAIRQILLLLIIIIISSAKKILLLAVGNKFSTKLKLSLSIFAKVIFSRSLVWLVGRPIHPINSWCIVFRFVLFYFLFFGNGFFLCFFGSSTRHPLEMCPVVFACTTQVLLFFFSIIPTSKPAIEVYFVSLANIKYTCGWACVERLS